jgi:signal transduction histidine kinase
MASQVEALVMGSASEEQAIPLIQRQLERMQQVVQTLPSLAWLDDSVRSASLIQLVKETLQLIPDNDQSRIALKVSVTSNPKVAQPTLVAQCLLSLLDNALQSQGEVKVLLEPYEGLVRIRIEDYGKGLPEEHLNLLKQPLFQLPDRVPDRVLRLAFVRHILDSFGGGFDGRNTEFGLEVVITLAVAEISQSSTQISNPRLTKTPDKNENVILSDS